MGALNSAEPRDATVPLGVSATWAAPARVRTLLTRRGGGVSLPPYASLNLGDHVGDDPLAVAENRRRVRAALPAEPFWLQQVHGTQVVCAGSAGPGAVADASLSREPGVVCAIMTADCLPVLLCDRRGQVVAAAHAGWRGLCAGVIEATVAAMEVAPAELLAYLGPAIGPNAFEVGDEVRSAFVAHAPEAASAFRVATPGTWWCDLALLARQRLAALGLTQVAGGTACTVTEADLYFSHRRDRVSGRMGAFI